MPAVTRAQEKRPYTADEKAKLLEEFLMAKVAGEGTELEICARMGVHRTTLHSWQAILERGGTLTDSKPGGRPPGPPSKKELAARARRRAAKNARPKGHASPGGSSFSKEDRIRIAREACEAPGEAGKNAIAKRIGVAPQTIYTWMKNYRDGRYGSPKQPAKPHQTVLFKEEPAVSSKKSDAIQVGRIVHADDQTSALRTEVALLKAELLRVKRMNRKLLGLVGEDD
jgi:transposase-like protein